MNFLELTGQVQTHLVEIYPNHWIHKATLTAVKQLQNEARKAGFDCRLASSFRSFERQKTIWNNKASGKTACLTPQNKSINLSELTELERAKAICLYSAIPGASRHHWGTDFDIYDFSAYTAGESPQLIDSEYQAGGKNHALSEWLQKNATQLGFHFPYNTPYNSLYSSSYNSSHDPAKTSDANHATLGIAPEPWHISYTPVSQSLEKEFSQNVFDKLISEHDFLLNKAILANNHFFYQTYIRQYYV